MGIKEFQLHPEFKIFTMFSEVILTMGQYQPWWDKTDPFYNLELFTHGNNVCEKCTLLFQIDIKSGQP